MLLALLVVAAAGLDGATQFSGPRWLPHWLENWWGTRNRRHLHRVKPTVPTGPPLRHRPPNVPPFELVFWIVVAIAVVVAAGLLIRRLARQRSLDTSKHLHIAGVHSEPLVEAQLEPDSAPLRTGIELALQVLDEQREPTDAVVRAWLGLQEAAEESGIARRAAETPTEFTSRILGRAFADDRAVRTLLRLYLRARFGDHPVTTDDVAVVRAALQEMVRTRPAPKISVGTNPR